MKVKQISQDEARVLCLFTLKLKYCSSSFKKPSLKEKHTKATNETYLPNPKRDSTKISIVMHVTKPHACISHLTLLGLVTGSAQRKQQLQRELAALSFSCTREMA